MDRYWWMDLDDPLERRCGRRLDELLEGSAASRAIGPMTRAAIVGVMLAETRDAIARESRLTPQRQL